jgi:hypothetical protein
MPAHGPVADTDTVVEKRLIWLVQLDGVLAADLTTQLGYFGYHVQAYAAKRGGRNRVALAGRDLPEERARNIL